MESKLDYHQQTLSEVCTSGRSETISGESQEMFMITLNYKCMGKSKIGLLWSKRKECLIWHVKRERTDEMRGNCSGEVKK